MFFKFGRNLFICSVIFILFFSANYLSDFQGSGDSRWVIYVSKSILEEGNTDLDEYLSILRSENFWGVENIGPSFYNYFPLGTSIIILPFLAPFKFFNIDLKTSRIKIEKFIASFILGIIGIVFYLICEQFLNKLWSVIIAFLGVFCSSIWSVAGMSLSQHGSSVLVLSLSLYLILLSRKKNWVVQFVSVPLFFSYIIRPSNIVSIIMLSIFIFLQYKKYFWVYLFWGLFILIPFWVFNYSIYHSLYPSYYLFGRIFSNEHFLEALAGNLISPSRGFFVYSPVFFFSIIGMIFERKKYDLLGYFLISIIFFHWIIMSSFTHWWGGHCFGPRFFTDIIPYFLFFLIFFIKDILIPTLSKSKFFLIFVFLFFSVLSFFIHFKGATNFKVFQWNSLPKDIDFYPQRLWNWNDFSFLR